MAAAAMKLDLSRIQLLGRQNELKHLQEALQRVTSWETEVNTSTGKTTTTTIFVEAASGTGKSCLVQTFLTRKESHILVGRGKFDDPPIGTFSALEEAVHQLCQDVSRREPNALEAEDVQSELLILSCTFPRLRAFASRTMSSSDVTTTCKDNHQQQQRSYERFKFSLRSLVRSLASHSTRTVILFLDDLQWATPQDLELVQFLAQDSHKTNSQQRFLLLASHQPVANHHPLISVKDALVTNSRTLHLKNLHVTQFAELLAALTSRDMDDTMELATVIHAKSHGNPFFGLQLILLLEQQLLLFYSPQHFRWEWDSARIMAQVDVADNVVDLVAGQLQSLSELPKEVLVTASCLGASVFWIDVLATTMAREPQELVSVLQSLSRQGFLEEMEEGRSYKFAHNRIQEGAYSLVSNKTELHATIGRRLRTLYKEYHVTSSAAGESEYLLLLTIRQLNQGLDRITTRDEQVEVSQLNCTAGRIAIQRSCFFPAAEFLQMGRRLLGKDAWSQHYSLMSQLTTLLARAEFCCGRLKESRLLCDEALQKVTSVDDKRDVYLAKMQCLMNEQGTLDGTVEIGHAACQDLGYPFPMRFLTIRVLLEIAQIKQILKMLSDDQLRNLPDASDERMKAALEVFQTTGELAINGVPPKIMLGNMIMVRAVYLTLKYGWTPMIGTCFMVWGWILHETGELEEACGYGEIGLHYANQRRVGREGGRAKMFYCMYIGHIKRSYHELIDLASNALKDMWTQGAVAYVCWDTYVYLRLYYAAGLPLRPLSLEIETYAALLRDYDNKTYYNNHVPYFQFVANLMGGAYETPTTLTGEFMEQSEYLAERRKDGNKISLQGYYFARLMAA